MGDQGRLTSPPSPHECTRAAEGAAPANRRAHRVAFHVHKAAALYPTLRGSPSDPAAQFRLLLRPLGRRPPRTAASAPGQNESRRSSSISRQLLPLSFAPLAESAARPSPKETHIPLASNLKPATKKSNLGCVAGPVCPLHRQPPYGPAGLLTGGFGPNDCCWTLALM